MKVIALAGMAIAWSLTASASVADAAPAKAAPARDWSRAVVTTPEGGFRMGNPAAKVKLVEYGSLACPHCRHFEETGFKPLLDGYVRTGRVSYEFRNLLINGPDISATLLTRCSGAANFFPMSRVVYATQPDWEKKVSDYADANAKALEGMTDAQRIVRFASVSGLVPVAARFGVTTARAKQCLTDKGALQRLLDMAKDADAHGIHHTPTFLIDGKLSEAATWEDLEPELKSALGG